MKNLRLKHIIIMIILISLIIIHPYTIMAGWCDGYLDPDDAIGNINVDVLVKNNNVYCVQHGQQLDNGSRTYYRRVIIKIEGNKVTYRQQEANGSTGQITNKGVEKSGNTCEENNIFAAILYSGGGYGSSVGNYTNTQLGVFQYWETWKSASGVSRIRRKWI